MQQCTENHSDFTLYFFLLIYAHIFGLKTDVIQIIENK